MPAIWRQEAGLGHQAKKSTSQEPPGASGTMCLSATIYTEEPGI